MSTKNYPVVWYVMSNGKQAQVVADISVRDYLDEGYSTTRGPYANHYQAIQERSKVKEYLNRREAENQSEMISADILVNWLTKMVEVRKLKGDTGGAEAYDFVKHAIKMGIFREGFENE